MQRCAAILLIGILTICPITGMQRVYAQTTEATPSEIATRFAIVPVDGMDGYFSISMESGETKELRGQVLAIDSAPVELVSYVTNATTARNGGFQADEVEDQTSSPASWITYGSETFTLSGREARDVNLVVNVPADALPGEYIAAFVAQTAKATPIPGSETFNQITRSVVAIFITVPGSVTPGFTLGTPAFSTDPGAPRVVIPVTNMGNVRLKPAGTINIAKPDGTEIVKAPITMGSVYAHDETTLEITLPEQLPTGDYVVSGTLTDAATKTSASIEKTTITLADRDAAPPTFTLDPVIITANATPIAFANVDITVNNAGQNIPTANVTLNVKRDGKDLESYPLAQNQAVATGATQITQRYIPLDGWQPGTYSFEVVVSSVSNGTETNLATVPVPDTILVP